MSIDQIQEFSEEQADTNARSYWKQRADMLALDYHSNIPTEKLKDLVQAKLAEQGAMGTKGSKYASMLAPEVRSMQDQATQLVRFKINVLDPSKANWSGMYVTVGNDNLAPVKRAIYFIEEAWHAERIIIEYLKAARYASRPKENNPRLKGTFNKYNKTRLLPMFHIQELPPLTQEELEDLAKYQAQNGTGQQED